MVLKLYGIPLSTCTRRVAVVAHEVNAPFELVEVDFMKGEHKGPEFLKKQPFGQVPVLVSPVDFASSQRDVKTINSGRRRFHRV